MTLWQRFLALFGSGLLLWSACTPGATPEPTNPPPTTTPTLIPYPIATEPPTLIPIALSGPTLGTTLPWIDGSTLVYVPAGPFVMGGRGHDNPVHSVSLSAYWITQTKITNRMYALCVGVGVCSPPATLPGVPLYTNPAYADHPVVGVTWEQANAYCGWAGGRLPTEAEWEKAARGPQGQPYPWGNEAPSCDRLNFNHCVRSTTPVNAYPAGASPYLALDMAGNVFEWVLDWYDAAYYANAPIQDPPGPESGTYRVIRGSSFESTPEQVDLSIRRPATPDQVRRDVGFRCVIQQPIYFPPYCQSTPYLPVSELPTPATPQCWTPTVQRIGPSCKGKSPSHTILLPRGSMYRVRSEGFTCTDTLVGNQIQVTCTGPEGSSGTLQVCNPACEVPTTPPWSGVPVCDPGYIYDPASRQCVYAPLPPQRDPPCPPGYTLDATGQTCRPAPGADQQCPVSQYYDTEYGGCVPANGQALCNLYGIFDPDLASTCYVGCPAGFAFNAEAQCCQTPATGLYPTCPVGYEVDPTLGGCVPRLPTVDLGTPGCIFVSVDMLRCSPTYDCSVHTTEAACIRASEYGCGWDEKKGACVKK